MLVSKKRVTVSKTKGLKPVKLDFFVLDVFAQNSYADHVSPNNKK